MRLVLLLAALTACGPGTDSLSLMGGDSEQLVWLPYSYRAVLDRDGVQTGWELAEFCLDMEPPAREAVGSGVVRMQLGFGVQQRKIQKPLEWVPPERLEEAEAIHEHEASSPNQEGAL